MDTVVEQQGALVSTLIDLIVKHIDEPLPETRLADLVGFSVSRIRHAFFEATGESLGRFIRRVRLERAAGELSVGSQSVVAIALGAGYQSCESFARAFGSSFQNPPSTFRALNQGPSCLLPGYLYSTDPVEVATHREVGIHTAEERITTYIYHGLSLIGRIEPESPT